MLSTVIAQPFRRMPLFLDNDMPSIVLRFGSDDANETTFSVNLDSCAAMSTANALLRIWIMTQHLEIIISYERFDDANAFQLIILDCAVSTSDAEKAASQLSAVVTYKTRYTTKYGKMMTLSFSLGDSISVNAIISLPTFKEWQLVLDVSTGHVQSKVLNTVFYLSFQHSASNLPPHLEFTKEYFIFPVCPNPSSQFCIQQLANVSAPNTVIATSNDNVVIALPANTTVASCLPTTSE